MYDNNSSTRSRATAESGETYLSNGLCRVSSISHPELWNTCQAALADINNDAGGGNRSFDASFNGSFNTSRNSQGGKVNLLFGTSNASRFGLSTTSKFSSSIASNQYFANLLATTSASGRQSLQQIQQLQIHLQSQPKNEFQQQLKKSGFEFDRICELDEFEKKWIENELKRTLSAPDLAS